MVLKQTARIKIDEGVTFETQRRKKRRRPTAEPVPAADAPGIIYRQLLGSINLANIR